MHREPDWQSLGEINFLLYRRMSEHLNAALAAISLMSTREAGSEPAEFWQERAMNEVLRSLNLHNAWASLVRHKQGEVFLPQHMLQFRASEMIYWLAAELQLPKPPALENDIVLSGNRETLQEALLLLHSCAHAMGPGVRLVAHPQADGVWFRIRYQVVKTAPPTLQSLTALLERNATNWRANNALFELKRACDFLAMNQCELHYRVIDGMCELAFFIKAFEEAGDLPAEHILVASIMDTAPVKMQAARKIETDMPKQAEESPAKT